MSPDFDDDGTLDHGDLEKLVNCLTGESADTRLTPEEMNQLITNVNMLRARAHILSLLQLDLLFLCCCN